MTMNRDVFEEYGPDTQPFGVLGAPLDRDDGTVRVWHRAQLEAEILYIQEVIVPSPTVPHRAVCRVLRGQEGTEAVSHPAGAELRLLGRER